MSASCVIQNLYVKELDAAANLINLSVFINKKERCM